MALSGKVLYAELIARCLSEYDRVNPLKMLDHAALEAGLHSLSRVVSSMAVLVADGDVTRYRELNRELYSDHSAFCELFAKLMGVACRSTSESIGKDALNFSVKELMLAYELSNESFNEAILKEWRKSLADIQISHYSHAGRTTNRNVYIMGGEQLRQKHGLASSEAFIDSCWERQREHFNRHGMYLDNFDTDRAHNPVLYDLTTRVQLKSVMFGAYSGQYVEQINEVLRRGALTGLLTQSAAFELPAGGRSNQFLFNEALLAADFEFEAWHYAAAGDLRTAGQFKQAARLAASGTLRWLERGKHIKNFSPDPTVGAERYGCYDKYMVTLSSFLALAYLFADDSVEECDCPACRGGHFFYEDENFHIVTANVAPYSIEIITDPDRHYDSAGLCRLHRAGAPTELGLSHSFTSSPKYKLAPGIEAADLSIDLPKVSGSGAGADVELIECSELEISFKLSYSGLGTVELYRLTPAGLDIEVNTDDHAIEFTVPVLTVGDGETELVCRDDSVCVKYRGYAYEVTSDGRVSLPEKLYCNRNGIYRAAHFFSNSGSLKLHLCLKGQNEK